MSVELNNDFFPDLRNIAMERLLQIIPNNAKVVVNTPCNTRFRKNPSSERKKKLFTLDFRNVTIYYQVTLAGGTGLTHARQLLEL